MSKRVWNVTTLCRIVKRFLPGHVPAFFVQVRAAKDCEWHDVWPDEPAFALAHAFRQLGSLNSWVLNGGEFNYE
jgi:hypothetical protein